MHLRHARRPAHQHSAFDLCRRNACIIGLPLDESERLLDELWAHASRPEFVWHNEWQVGDTLIWDNRALIHRRDAFDNNQRRMMHRVQIRGETTS